ncbi:MAG: sulfite exporter TauE/SafE family protein [Rhodospirillales bacterium]|nr:sulfite exporter TauE/SafE family protein [Rhodospirillales bacterium]
MSLVPGSLALLRLCQPIAAAPGASLVLALAIAGLAGSVPHCVPMCGPFVLAQAGARVAALPATCLAQHRRLRAALLLPYHMGRALTYATLGALVGGLGGLPWLAPLRAPLLAVAAMGFLVAALRRLRVGAVRGGSARGGGGWQHAWGAWLARRSRRFDPASSAGSFGLGLVLGLLPCGMLAMALTAVAGAGSAWLGAGAMLAFAAGNAPALIAVGYAGVARASWSRRLTAAVPYAMLANTTILATLALLMVV